MTERITDDFDDTIANELLTYMRNSGSLDDSLIYSIKVTLRKAREDERAKSDRLQDVREAWHSFSRVVAQLIPDAKKPVRYHNALARLNGAIWPSVPSCYPTPFPGETAAEARARGCNVAECVKDDASVLFVSDERIEELAQRDPCTGRATAARGEERAMAVEIQSHRRRPRTNEASTCTCRCGACNGGRHCYIGECPDRRSDSASPTCHECKHTDGFHQWGCSKLPHPADLPSEAFKSGYNAGRFSAEHKTPYSLNEAWATYRAHGGSPRTEPALHLPNEALARLAFETHRRAMPQAYPLGDRSTFDEQPEYDRRAWFRVLESIISASRSAPSSVAIEPAP